MVAVNLANGLTAGQYRAARAMLGLGIAEASRLARVSAASVAMVERGTRPTGEGPAAAMRAAYEAAGIRFLGGDGSGSGVMFEPPQLPGCGPPSSVP